MDDLSLLFRLKGDSAGLRTASTEGQAAIGRLKQSFGPQLTQTVTLANKAFSTLGDNLTGFVSQHVPVFGGAIARVSDGLRGLGSSTAVAGSSFAALAAPVGLAVAAVGGFAVALGLLGKQIFEASKATAEFQGKFFDLSQQVGVAVETLSTLDVIASQTGGNIETVTASMGIFQKALENAHDPSDKQAKLLKEIGVTSLDTETALRQTLAGLFKLGEGAKQTDAVLQLFGRSGRFVNAILKESGGNLDEATEKFTKMGLVVSTEAAAAADQFNDSLELLSRQIAAVTRGLVSDTIPVFTVFFQQINQSLTGNKDDWTAWSNVIKVEVAAALGTIQGFAQFVASLGNIPLSITIDSNIRTLLEEADKLSNKLRFEADIQRLQRLTQAVRAGRPGDRPDSGSGESKRALANELEELQDSIGDREKAFQAETEDLRRELAKREVDFQNYINDSIAKNKERLAATLADLEKERAAVQRALTQKVIDANEAAKKLRQIDNQERDIRRTAEKEQQRLDDEAEAHKRKQAEATIEVLKTTIDAQLRIAAIGDQQREAAIRALAELRIKTEEDAEREILQIRLDAIDREKQRLEAAIAATQSIADPEEQLKERARLNLELRVLVAQRLAIEQDGEREVEASRQRDVENERRYTEELEDIREQAIEAERDAAEEVIRLMITSFARRKDIIRAERDLELQREEDRHRRETGRINEQKRQVDEEIRLLEKRLERLKVGTTEEIEEHERLIESLEKLKAARAGLDQQQETEDKRTKTAIETITVEAELKIASPDVALRDAFDSIGESLTNLAGKFADLIGAGKEFALISAQLASQIGGVLAGAFEQVANAIGQTVSNWVLLGETGPAVMRKILAQALASVAAEAAVNAIKELALGFAMLFINPAASAAHFTAAALWGSIAGVAAIAGRGVAGDLFKPKSASASSGGGGRDGTGQLDPLTLNRNQNQPRRIIVEFRAAQDKMSQAFTAVVLDDIDSAGPIREALANDVRL